MYCFLTIFALIANLILHAKYILLKCTQHELIRIGQCLLWQVKGKLWLIESVVTG